MPQRTQSSRPSSIPAAAAEAASKVSETSIQAATFPLSMTRATRECAKEVLPEHSGPVTSLIPPTGNPPFRRESSESTPEETTGLTVFTAGDRAEGILLARALST